MFLQDSSIILGKEVFSTSLQNSIKPPLHTFWFVGPEVMSPPCILGGSTCLGLPPGRHLVGSEPSGRHALPSISLYFPGLSLPDLLV